MITKFKIFENISVPYKEGDYILIDIFSRGITYNNMLAKIKTIENVDSIFITIDHEKFDININYVISSGRIKYWSEDKEELEIFINSKKYNL